MGFFVEMISMPNIKIDNKEYDLDTLPDECKGQLASIQFVDEECTRLQAKVSALQTAKVAYLHSSLCRSAKSTNHSVDLHNQANQDGR